MLCKLYVAQAGVVAVVQALGCVPECRISLLSMFVCKPGLRTQCAMAMRQTKCIPRALSCCSSVLVNTLEQHPNAHATAPRGPFLGGRGKGGI